MYARNPRFKNSHNSGAPKDNLQRLRSDFVHLIESLVSLAGTESKELKSKLQAAKEARERQEVVARSVREAERLQASGDLQGALTRVGQGLIAFPADPQLLEAKAALESVVREREEWTRREQEQAERREQERKRREDAHLDFGLRKARVLRRDHQITERYQLRSRSDGLPVHHHHQRLGDLAGAIDHLAVVTNFVPEGRMLL